MNGGCYKVNGKYYSSSEISDKTGWNRIDDLWIHSDEEIQLRVDMLRAVIEQDGEGVNTNHIRQLGVLLEEHSRRTGLRRQERHDKQIERTNDLLAKIAVSLSALGQGSDIAHEELADIRETLKNIESTLDDD